MPATNEANETPPEKPKPAPKAAAAEKLTPLEWARRKGLLVEATPERPWVEPHAKGFHACAEQLYGWLWHAANYQDPKQAFTLTEADYDKALETASRFPEVPVHEAALAPGWKKPVYGGLFWINGTGEYALPKDTFYMAGAGGQTTFVVPSRDLVIVRMGHFRGDGEEMRKGLDEALRGILEAVEPAAS